MVEAVIAVRQVCHAVAWRKSSKHISVPDVSPVNNLNVKQDTTG